MQSTSTRTLIAYLAPTQIFVSSSSARCLDALWIWHWDRVYTTFMHRHSANNYVPNSFQFFWTCSRKCILIGSETCSSKNFKRIVVYFFETFGVHLCLLMLPFLFCTSHLPQGHWIRRVTFSDRRFRFRFCPGAVLQDLTMPVISARPGMILAGLHKVAHGGERHNIKLRRRSRYLKWLERMPSVEPTCNVA